MPSPLGEGQAVVPSITVIWVRSKRTDKKEYQVGVKYKQEHEYEKPETHNL